jgi:hypothetical protein
MLFWFNGETLSLAARVNAYSNGLQFSIRGFHVQPHAKYAAFPKWCCFPLLNPPSGATGLVGINGLLSLSTTGINMQ